jgi:low affinity Fe/Cu permease
MQRFIKSRFEILAEWISRNLGHPYAFCMAFFTVFLWAMLGPLFGFSDTWQLVINTGTTIVTFLMVFLLQNTGNRGIEQMDQRIQLLEAQNQQLLHAIQRLTQVVEHK